jgi:hypothetical protein
MPLSEERPPHAFRRSSRDLMWKWSPSDMVRYKSRGVRERPSSRFARSSTVRSATPAEMPSWDQTTVR